MARAERIVDVGAGSGHFTRLAADRFDVDALGIDRDAARVRAAALAARAARSQARFAVLDASRGDLHLEPKDLAVGLHACGELGDIVTLAAIRAGCDLALVSCCPQKRRDPVRRPLSNQATELVLSREHLGLANLSSRPCGVETSLATTLAARETRVALRLLLNGRGLSLQAGEEMHHINRRRPRAGLAEVARVALAARGLAAATEVELARCQREAARQYARARRLSLPRNMLARLLEIAVVLDRAAALEEAGYAVTVGTLFDEGVTPRNIAILATRPLTQF